MPSPPNILLVAVDCLRQDFTVGNRAHTPTLDSFRRSGTEYRDLYASTTNTTPSVASLLTGTYSERNGVNSLRNVELNDEIRTLAEITGERGYETAALATGPIIPETGLQRGFDHFDHRDPAASITGDWYDHAVETVSSLSEPFFLYVHLWELHTPIDVPAAFDKPAYGRTPYARMLSALDRSLKRFFDEIPDETVIAIHGDHGESISWRQHLLYWPCKLARDGLRYLCSIDTRGLEQRVNRALDAVGPSYRDHFFEEGHGETIFDYVTNVPLMIRGPGIPSATVDAQCRQVDVMPTLTELADCSEPSNIDGESLLPPDSVTDRPAYMRACGPSLLSRKNWKRGLRTPEYKFIEYPNRDTSPELYDLREDERELRNVAPDNPDVVADLKSRLDGRQLRSTTRLDIDDHLEDLGYL